MPVEWDYNISMDRRSFIKTAATGAAVGPIALAASTNIDIEELDSESISRDYPFYVECFIRQQKEWVFSEYVKDLFDKPSKAVKRSYPFYDISTPIIFSDGKTRLKTMDDAINLVQMHVQTCNVTAHDVIYEVYYSPKNNTPDQHVGHYWYNGDTGRNVYWRSSNPSRETNWLGVESA